MATETQSRSMFMDRARVTVRGGRGGDGCMCFRREKYVDRGGPDGGNGGRGGDVIMISDAHKKSLLDLTYKPHFYAGDGMPGLGSNKTGHGGDDLLVYVPIGTVVHNGDQIVADLKTHGQTQLVARAGRGGRGNAAFKTQRNTAPMLSEKGEPGEEFVLDLELKLLADIGLVGMPNAGKSTLLARMTSARPKIADYPFTTLNPNLGVVEWRSARFIMADIPGLIEGAHAGRGLGHDFLRHIERTRMLFHLVDVYGFQNTTAAQSIRIIQKELREYSKILVDKPTVIVVNKMDLTGADKIVAALKKTFKKFKIFPISAATGEGIDPLLKYAAKILAMPEQEKVETAPEEPMRFVVELDYRIEKKPDHFLVQGTKVERLASMTNFTQPEAVRRFQNILKKMGVEKELVQQGVQQGDSVRIGKVELTFEP